MFLVRKRNNLFLIFSLLSLELQHAFAQPATFAGNPQHTALYDVSAQPLNRIRWTAPTDVHYTGFAHYGAPLITAANTVLVPVKTASGFRVDAFDGATGSPKYSLTNDYIMPPIAANGWVPVYQPVLADGPSGQRLYYAGPGGTVYYIENVDSASPTSPVQLCFYTNLAYYSTNAAGTNGFNNTVFMNTPITADTNGNIFFGFRIQFTAPPPLKTTNGGFARITSDGSGSYVFANSAAADPRITRDSHNCAPALSRDGSTLYVVVKGTNSSYAYLLGLDASDLTTKYRVFLRDPRNGFNALVIDDGTASPMVGPDGDVFFGVLGNPSGGSRGFLLHFSADLLTQKLPSGFGWDYTPAVVPADMVPGYIGPSSYLLFSKYNNYAGSNGDGDGINRIALLDPNATQIDGHPSANRLVEMREVMTVIGCTPDDDVMGTNFPYAVREWCINTAAVNPPTKSVFSPSEDGHLYRWDLAANSLSEVVALSPGFGEPYVPTVIGPDGTVYTISGETLFAIGEITNDVAIRVFSSQPDLRTVVSGQALTFTAVVTNLNASGPAPTGTVTFIDRTFSGIRPVTNILATGVTLTNGSAAISTSSLSADTNHWGSHYISVNYSGDTLFPAGAATMVEKVHAFGTTTSLTPSPVGSNNAVVVSANVASYPVGNGTPTGQVTFWDGSALLGQAPLAGGFVSLTISNFAVGAHSLTATYASDTLFASSRGQPLVTAPYLSGMLLQTNGMFQLTFTNVIGAPFSVLSTADLTLPMANWTVMGTATETAPGQYSFIDSTTASNQRFYIVRSP